jgi:ABC-2 type transport system permease protein
MVAHLLRLRLDSLLNVRRRPLPQVIGMIVAVVVLVVLAIALTIAIAGLGATTPEIAHVSLVVVGSALTLGFFLVPLVFGADGPMDPRRFVLFGIRPRPLAFVLAAGGAPSLPLFLLFVLLMAQVEAWDRGPGPVALALTTLVLVLVQCALAARVGAGLASAFLSGRRQREVVSGFFVLLIAVAAPVLLVIGTLDWETRGLPIVRRLASALTWSPLGAAWSLPGGVLIGQGDATVGKILVVLASLAVLWVVWELTVRFVLMRPDREAQRRQSRRLGWFDRFPGTPTGAIAARSASYWARDSRYGLALAAIPVAPIIMVGALLIGGVPPEVVLWIPVPVMCLFIGWMLHNDLAFDSSAFWAHVSADVSGLSDRIGRLAPAAVLGLPVAIGGSAISVAIAGRWDALPGLLGLSLGLLVIGFGVSSVTSAAAPYATVHPGDSPFAQPQGSGSGGSVVQSLSFLATLLLIIPVIALVLLGETQDPSWHWAAFGAGLVLGAAVLVGGVLWGARVVDRSAPELLAFTLRN